MTHQRSPNFSLPFVSRWLFVSRLEVFVGCKNYTKTLRSKLQNWQSDNHWPLRHRNAAMIGWPVDRLTLIIWGHCVWASESSSAFGQFLDRRDPTDAPDQCLWMCDGSDSFLDIRFLPRRSCPCGCRRAETGGEDAGENKNDSMKHISTKLSQFSILKLIRWL